MIRKKNKNEKYQNIQSLLKFFDKFEGFKMKKLLYFFCDVTQFKKKKLIYNSS